MRGLSLLAEFALVPLLADGLVFVAIVGCGLYGWGKGLFRATILGFSMLGSFVGALATAELTASLLTTLEVSDNHASWIAYLGTLALLLYASLAAADAFASGEMWFSDGFFSRTVASAIGCVAGFICAGSLLIGWSMIPLPKQARFECEQLTLDAGQYAIGFFGKCVERDPERLKILLGGCEEQVEGVRCCSEPFVDHNQNCMRDDDEPFIDCDGNGSFTLTMNCGRSRSKTDPSVEQPFVGWKYGLLDYYRLGSWETPACLHAPRLTSLPATKCEAADMLAGVLYQANAEDVDGCDQQQLKFEITPKDSEVAGIIIDGKTGTVTLAEDEIELRRPEYRFTISVEDSAGLTDELPVLVKVRYPDDAHRPP